MDHTGASQTCYQLQLRWFSVFSTGATDRRGISFVDNVVMQTSINISGTSYDRDVNAAINIRNEGIRILKEQYDVAI